MAGSARRCAVEDLGSSLRFVMPYRTQWLTVGLQLASVLFLAAALAAVVWSVTKLIPLGRWLFLLLPFLTVGTVLVLAPLTHWSVELLWQLVGKEVVDVDDGSIAIGHQVLGSRLGRSYSAESIGAVFVAPPSDNWFSARYSAGASFGNSARARFDRGRVALAAGRTPSSEVVTVRFGSSLDEEEARQVVATIHRRFPRYASAAR
jgi:hypothetical protein